MHLTTELQTMQTKIDGTEKKNRQIHNFSWALQHPSLQQLIEQLENQQGERTQYPSSPGSNR